MLEIKIMKIPWWTLTANECGVIGFMGHQGIPEDTALKLSEIFPNSLFFEKPDRCETTIGGD
jgi:hypothetical protein